MARESVAESGRVRAEAIAFPLTIPFQIGTSKNDFRKRREGVFNQRNLRVRGRVEA